MSYNITFSTKILTLAIASFLKNFAEFTGKHLCQSLFLIKSLTHVFSCEFCEIFKSTFFYRSLLVAASVYVYFIWDPPSICYGARCVYLTVASGRRCTLFFLKGQICKSGSTVIYLNHCIFLYYYAMQYI